MLYNYGCGTLNAIAPPPPSPIYMQCLAPPMVGAVLFLNEAYYDIGPNGHPHHLPTWRHYTDHTVTGPQLATHMAVGRWPYWPP